MFSIVKCWGFPVFKGCLEVVDYSSAHPFLINTISPNSYGLSVHDAAMAKALKGSDILILDGVYFGLLPLLKYGKRINRITGWDSLIYFSCKLQAEHGRALFLGSTEETLAKIKRRYAVDYPDVEVMTLSPPFKTEFSEEDNKALRATINSFRPDVLFVGMTAPKQEKWAYMNKNFLDVNIISTIGNAFDWYAGNARRPSVIWQKLGLEWLIRIFYRKEIFRRNIRNQLRFFQHLLLYIMHLKKFD
jgi:N-acetylglucosaminyldiphosphoundecaprenol N-acetyl-beta-D-mannosaminyltransferase